MTPLTLRWLVVAVLLLCGIGNYAAIFWQPGSPGPPICAGSVALTALELSKTVTFPIAFPSTNYSLSFTASVSSELSYSTKTESNFTLNVTVGIARRIDYIAVQQPQ